MILILIFHSYILIDNTVAHIGEHVSIQLLTEKINKDNKNSELYLKRGIQHKFAGHFDLAVIDFAQAEKLDDENYKVDLYRGQLFLDLGWYVTSQYYLNKYLEHSPDDTTALISMAKALMYQRKGYEATVIYSRALLKMPKPTPEFYNLMADSYLIHNDFSEAVRILDEGISNLGNNTYLQEKAIKIELKNKMYSNALSRIDRLLQFSPQKEKWLYKKGQILESLGRFEEAKEAYVSALQNLESRPPNKRRISALVDIKREIEKSLDKLSQK